MDTTEHDVDVPQQEVVTSQPIDADDLSTISHSDFYKSKLSELKKLGYDTVRKLFRNGVQNSKAYVRYMAEAALQHYADNGDTYRLNTLLSDIETVGKNYLRREAYLKWLFDHAPLMIEARKIVQDAKAVAEKQWTDDIAKATLLGRALAMPFWEYSPEARPVIFDSKMVIKAMYAAIKRFEGESYKANTADPTASSILLAAKAKMVELERIVQPITLVPATAAPAEAA